MEKRMEDDMETAIILCGFVFWGVVGVQEFSSWVRDWLGF